MLDREVRTRFRDGDAAAVRAVYRDYGRLMHAVAYRILGDRGLAEEATQQAFLKAWRASATLDETRELGPWLAMIAKRTAIDVHRREAVRAADPHFAMVVKGTPLAPGLHGKANLTKTASGWKIELAAPGLPHLENGRYYQAWLKNAAGILVTVGTFNDARQVTLWSGVPVTKFRTLTVTEQRANGNPASSGRVVLMGTITPAG